MSRCIHVIAYVRIFFLFKIEGSSILCTYHILFIHSSVAGHLGCFYYLAIVNYAALNMCALNIKTLLGILLDVYPKVELLDYLVYF